MQISSIIDIVGGELLNSPAISFITQIHTNTHKINDGDLFVSNCQEDIQIAINNGAFAIIYNDNIEIIDTEIAWIKVSDIKLALIKLSRFILSNQTIKSFSCDTVCFDLFKLFSTKRYNHIFLTGNIIEDFELIKKYSEIDTIFSYDIKYLQSIQPLSSGFIINNYKIQNLTKHSLFNTTFSYKARLFSKLKLPSLYINKFLSILEFYNGEVDLDKLKYLQHFIPIFINKNSEIIEFGKSHKFILTNTTKDIEEIAFLNEEYGYAKLKIIDNILNDNELFHQINNLDFNALYIVGKSYNDVQNLLEKYKKNLTTLI